MHIYITTYQGRTKTREIIATIANPDEAIEIARYLVQCGFDINLMAI